MWRKWVYEVCMNVFSTVCTLELLAPRTPNIRALSLFHIHTQTSTIVEFGKLGARGALGFSLLTCTFDASDIVRLVKHFEIIHGAQSSRY
jgi:hypothetical protein